MRLASLRTIGLLTIGSLIIGSGETGMPGCAG